MILVKIPAINGLGKTRGCEKTPNLLCEKYSCEEIKVNNQNIEKTQNNINSKAKEILKKNKFVLFLGGDHSISFPLVKAFSLVNKDAGLIVFDAHADCMPVIKEPTHEEWLRALVGQGFDSKNILFVGLRKVEPEESEFLKKKGINRFWMKDFSNKSIDTITEKARKFPSLYLSIDIDVFDPAFAPGTAYREKGGLTFKEFSSIIKNIKDRLKAADIVEINPEKDINNRTIKLGKKIIDKLKK